VFLLDNFSVLDMLSEILCTVAFYDWHPLLGKKPDYDTLPDKVRMQFRRNVVDRLAEMLKDIPGTLYSWSQAKMFQNQSFECWLHHQMEEVLNDYPPKVIEKPVDKLKQWIRKALK